MSHFTRPARKPDYADSFAGMARRRDLPPKALMAYALQQTPAWFAALMRLRDRLGRLVGLKTAEAMGGRPDASFLMKMPVLRDDAQVYASGMADKHLDFALTAERHPDGRVSFTTEIWFNGTLGRVYLALVLPFHRAILRHWVRAIENMPEATS